MQKSTGKQSILYNFQSTYLLMGLWLVNTESLHEPAVLLHGKGFGLAFFPRPLEDARFQTLVEEKKAVSLPVQRLDPIPSSSAEKKQTVLQRIQ